MKVLLHRLAREELIAAAQYLEREARLVMEFLDAFAAWSEKIALFPKSAPLLDRNIRKGLLRRFHYIITYEVNDDSIRVLYIRHAKQKTLRWTARR